MVFTAYSVWLTFSLQWLHVQVWTPLLVFALLHATVCAVLSAVGTHLSWLSVLWLAGAVLAGASATMFAWPALVLQCVLLAVWPALAFSQPRAQRK